MIVSTLALLNGLLMLAFEVSRALAPKGESVHPSVHPFIRPSVDSPSLSQPREGLGPRGKRWNRRINGRRDGCTYRFPLSSTRLRPPSGPRPKRERKRKKVTYRRLSGKITGWRTSSPCDRSDIWVRL